MLPRFNHLNYDGVSLVLGHSSDRTRTYCLSLLVGGHLPSCYRGCYPISGFLLTRTGLAIASNRLSVTASVALTQLLADQKAFASLITYHFPYRRHGMYGK